MRRIGGVTLEDKFFARVLNSEDTSNCWVWDGTSIKGYGRMYFRGVIIQSHRASYWIHHGTPAPPDLCVCHTCDNPACVNPHHLWLGTHSDNQWDKCKKHRHHGQKKTHCPRGHEYTQENTGYGTRGNGNKFRVCRKCKREDYDPAARKAKYDPVKRAERHKIKKREIDEARVEAAARAMAGEEVAA